jgi:hypothetical protein
VGYSWVEGGENLFGGKNATLHEIKNIFKYVGSLHDKHNQWITEGLNPAVGDASF